MQNLTLTFANDPLVFILALFFGILPAALWLIFWLREDNKGRHEPPLLIVITFLAGMLSVVFVLPIEHFIQSFVESQAILITLWATSEEIFKYLAFGAIMTKSAYLDRPVTYAIYMVTAGLGFAALENAMYLIHPIAINNGIVSILTGNMRFLGSTLLHSVTSGLIGISLGLAFFKSPGMKFFYLIFGTLSAIALHSVFNFFIMIRNGENFLQVFGFLWVVTIIIMLLFEKLRRMGSYVEQEAY